MWSEADDANLPPTPTAGKKARKKASGKRTGKQVATLLGGGAKLPLPAGPSAIASPLDLIVAFVRAWDAGDADALAALFVDDADFINVVGLWWTSRLSIRRAHAWGFEKIFPNSTLTLEKLSQRLLGDDVAVVHARRRIDGQVDPHGEPAESRRGGVQCGGHPTPRRRLALRECSQHRHRARGGHEPQRRWRDHPDQLPAGPQRLSQASCSRCRVLLPNRDSTRSTASSAVALRTSRAGLSSTRSREASRPVSAIISMHS